MRLVVPTFFAEPQPEVYTHTANSRVYLEGPVRGNFKMMYEYSDLRFQLVWLMMYSHY